MRRKVEVPDPDSVRGSCRRVADQSVADRGRCIRSRRRRRFGRLRGDRFGVFAGLHGCEFALLGESFLLVREDGFTLVVRGRRSRLHLVLFRLVDLGGGALVAVAVLSLLALLALLLVAHWALLRSRRGSSALLSLIGRRSDLRVELAHVVEVSRSGWCGGGENGAS